jgi:hypothetical protein
MIRWGRTIDQKMVRYHHVTSKAETRTKTILEILLSFDWTTRRLGESAPAMTGRASNEYRLVQSVWTASFNPLS